MDTCSYSTSEQCSNTYLKHAYLFRQNAPSLSRPRQGFVHELLLGETQPPLAGLAVLSGEDPFANPDTDFLPQLLQILFHQIRLRRGRRFGIDRIQRKPGLSGDIELGNGQRVHLLKPLVFVGAPLQPLQTLGDVQGDVD